VARAANPGTAFSWSVGGHDGGAPMVSITRFGKKLPTPSTFQIKHQFLVWWLKDQVAQEAAEDGMESNTQRTNQMHNHDAGF
jgi:hypothetical protein